MYNLGDVIEHFLLDPCIDSSDGFREEIAYEKRIYYHACVVCHMHAGSLQ
jgi:hypothetical protein